MYPGVLEFFSWARTRKIDLAIVSHKTRHPFIGPQYDLHRAAREWVDHHLVDDSDRLIDPAQVYFELTKDDKIRRIPSLRAIVLSTICRRFFWRKNFPRRLGGFFSIRMRTTRRFQVSTPFIVGKISRKHWKADAQRATENPDRHLLARDGGGPQDFRAGSLRSRGHNPVFSCRSPEPARSLPSGISVMPPTGATVWALNSVYSCSQPHRL